ncbi:hypothetical protein XM38_033210 [Halomicronema hongdechloris C2206]|uniref:Uncharacterized protein n=1 Tax=Halomicronema hongdechloris C2206 TaxID=1641165 RepID=A0A1Z3HPX9_9CYAN|nr:hypothetical protein XM38_033210 [Halomicronema hongdechloris C2206]
MVDVVVKLTDFCPVYRVKVLNWQVAASYPYSRSQATVDLRDTTALDLDLE